MIELTPNLHPLARRHGLGTTGELYMTTTRINPLSRIPRQQRLVIAIRGGAGVGKSFFARSMSDAGIGRLCIFDTERKSRLLKGVGQTFDALEIEQPDELPEFIDWALSGEGREQNYGCFALDSWAAYFGAKHAETIKAVRNRTGSALSQPNAEELSSDQMVLQGVLRRLCMESGKSVVIIDQIAARGKETREDNEYGRVLPMTASGLEYFVDVMVEVSLQERDGEITRVFQVVKTNSPAFEVGFELTGNVTFNDFLTILRAETGAEIAVSPKLEKVEPILPEPTPVAPAHAGPTIHDLLEKAEKNGFKQNDLVTAARMYHNQPNIFKLTPAEIEDLDLRMSTRIERTRSQSSNSPQSTSQRIRRPTRNNTAPDQQH
jgi:hypothetical protein